MTAKFCYDDGVYPRAVIHFGCEVEIVTCCPQDVPDFFAVVTDGDFLDKMMTDCYRVPYSSLPYHGYVKNVETLNASETFQFLHHL